jgi:UDP-N-acetyl-D-glucosamine dehydrogenase
MTGIAVELEGKIESKRAVIAVVGLGYVGLPLAVAFSRRGFRLLGIESDKDRFQQLKKKTSYITDVPGRHLREAINSGRLRPESDFSSLGDADVVIICVPTPLKRRYSPDISFILKAVEGIKRHLRRGQLIILESTTYPGTTEEVILPLLEQGGLRCGRDFYLVFSPERIDPGNAKFSVQKIPKVVGGLSIEATELAALLYGHIVECTVRVSSPRVAETVKLLENTFRIVNIGLIDEIAMMAHKMKIDIWEVIEAAKTKPFGFMPFYPGPGVGGHCIPKDPLYLYWKARKFGFHSRFIRLASDVITSMPEYVVIRLGELLRKRGVVWDKARILVVGLTYKKDIKDLRQSPALDIIESLKAKGAEVFYHDPLIPYLRINHLNLKSLDLSPDKLSSFDCVVIATDHSRIDYGLILRQARIIFDTRNAYKALKDDKVIRL